jgi:hypothetical protein
MLEELRGYQQFEILEHGLGLDQDVVVSEHQDDYNDEANLHP